MNEAKGWDDPCRLLAFALGDFGPVFSLSVFIFGFGVVSEDFFGGGPSETLDPMGRVMKLTGVRSSSLEREVLLSELFIS
jgi:hypothetical protein